MASDEMRKKWGTIFMGDREASVEQLNAMQERLNHDKIKKEQTQDYMERVRARATDRAREILGEAYTERQKVLDEAKAEAAASKRLTAQECAKIKAQGEELRQRAQAELEAAQAEREEAKRLRETAHDEGYQEGMNQAGAELHEFRAEMGNSLGALMRAIERQRRDILENWRNELVGLVQAAVQAGTGYVLREEHEEVLRRMVCQALDLLENRSSITVRVNPQDEETVSDMFRAARERAPELRQWTVHGDETVEPGGLLADSGSGSVDLQRANFREMVDGILGFLALPESEREAAQQSAVASLVEQEVAHIASLTPEPDLPSKAEAGAEPDPEDGKIEELPGQQADGPEPEEKQEAAAREENPQEAAQPEVAENRQPQITDSAEQPLSQDAETADASLAELEEELFPLEEESGAAEALPPEDKAQEASPEEQAQKKEKEELAAELDNELDAKTLNEGGFL